VQANIAIDEQAGTVQVCDPRLFRAGRRAFGRRLLEAAMLEPAVLRVEVDIELASCRVEFGPGSVGAPKMASTFAAAVRAAAEESPNAERSPLWRLPSDWCALTASRVPGNGECPLWETFERRPGGIRVRNRSIDASLIRLKNLALAGGSFALTLVGLVVPGIPTIPFLLATSYYLARSSPWLDEKLRQTAFFGPILAEWEQYGGLSWKSKEKLVVLAGVTLAVTLILTPLSPLTLAVVVVLWCLGLRWISRLPGLSQEQEARLRPGGAPGPAVAVS
jgi:uncharacterized membrane protein YbaN (DUF454 family)